MSLEISGVSLGAQTTTSKGIFSEMASNVDAELQKEFKKPVPAKLTREQLLERRAYYETQYDMNGLKGREDEIYQRIVDENGKETLIYESSTSGGLDYKKVEIDKSHAYTIIRDGAPLCESPEKALKSENRGFVVYISNSTGRIDKINSYGDLYDFRYIDIEPDPSMQYKEWKF